MKRTILLALFGVLFSNALAADKFTDAVKDLGAEGAANADGQDKRGAAVQTLAKAGTQAYDALVEGLKTERKGEGEELRKNSQIRLHCARLLGALADTRAGAELLKLFKAEAVEAAADPEFAAACAAALGQVWTAKPADAGAREAATALKEAAKSEKMSDVIKLGCLHGLAGLRDGADVAAPLVKGAKEPVMQSAAIGVVVACAHKASADDLLDLWETQRIGPKGADGKRAGATAADYTKPLGLQALLGLASFGDKRAVDGLVDVITRNEFVYGTFNNLRAHCTNLLKEAPLKAPALEVLVALMKNEEAGTQWRQAAITMGDLGADGVKALLAIAAEKPPEGKDAEHYRRRVDQQLVSLTSETALKAFVEAWATLGNDEKNKSIRDNVLTQLINYRTSLKDEGVKVFKEAANNTALDDARRAQCIHAYCESRGKDSFEDLKVWITDAKPVIRAQAVDSLGRSYIAISKSRELLEKTLKESIGDEMAKVRVNALRGLQRCDDKKLLPLFIDAMNPEAGKEPSAEVRKAAISSIQEFRRASKAKEEDIFEAIKARANDTDPGVRAVAVPAAAGMAERVGQPKAANEIIEKALTDNDKDVRVAAYGQVGIVAREVKLDALVDAALKELEIEPKRSAVQALSQAGSLTSLTTQQSKLDAVVDLAVSVAENQGYQGGYSRSLVKNLKEQAGAFSAISTKTLAAIDRNVSDTSKQYQRASFLVPLLTEIGEEAAVEKIKKLAGEPDVELRRACVGYFSALGRREDVPFLRTLMDKGDNASAAVRAEIDGAIRTIETRP